MKIYTKTGDTGKATTVSGRRVDKDDLIIDAYGNLDELNCVIGIVLIDSAPPVFIQEQLKSVQKKLFEIGKSLENKNDMSIRAEHIDALEKEIDSLSAQLPELKSFLLPGGDNLTTAHCHFARAVCRRAERSIVALNKQMPVNPYILQYMNRLSDFLFVIARFLSQS